MARNRRHGGGLETEIQRSPFSDQLALSSSNMSLIRAITISIGNSRQVMTPVTSLSGLSALYLGLCLVATTANLLHELSRPCGFADC